MPDGSETSSFKNKYIIKYKEQILYIIFGAATTLVNWLSYTLLLFLFSLTISNAVAWFISVLFAFVVNKLYVFERKETSVTETAKELLLFFLARIATGVIEIFGLPLLVYIGLNQEIFGIEGAVAKIIISVFVIIANYIFSKFIIFRKQKAQQPVPDRINRETDVQ